MISSCSTAFEIKSSLHLWQDETRYPSIPTFSRSLDDLICDGVKLGCVTEVLGLPGTGKTQLGMQLCASVQVPKSLGGLEGESVYIDTNTNFTIQRFTEILKASMQKCHQILEIEEDIDLNKHLKKFHYVDAFGIEQFQNSLKEIPIFLHYNPNVRLIVIDSIGFPFKEGISERKRTGILFTEIAKLQNIAVNRQIAIVLINEMSTRVYLSGGSLVGALGDSWAHRSNTRLLLSTVGSYKAAVILKSNVRHGDVAQFVITSEGVRDVK